MAEQDETYEAGAVYRVRLTRPVTVGPFRYLPRDTPRMKGKIVNRIIEEHGADAIASAERV